MKTIKVPNGIAHLAESKAVCPYCERHLPFDELEEKYMKQDNLHIRIKCKCKHFIGVTQDIRGDYRAYEL